MISNIVAIGEGFRNNSQKVTRVYEKITKTKGETFRCMSTCSINLKNMNEEAIGKLFEVYESTILNDEYLDTFCFDSMEDFEKFDKDGILKERCIIIDKIEDEDYGMTVDELWSYCNKSRKSFEKGGSKVVFFDSSNGKEYMVAEFEPRRNYFKETDTTVEFSIYPVKSEMIKEVSKVKLSVLIQSKLDEANKNVNWLATAMDIAQSSLYGKFERDSFNAYDIIKIAKIFNIGIEELLERVV